MGKKVIRLTESDLEKIVERVINEQTEQEKKTKGVQEFLNLKKITGYNKKPLDVDGKTDNMLQSQTAQAETEQQFGPLIHRLVLSRGQPRQQLHAHAHLPPLPFECRRLSLHDH
jgi:hypothetical protein